MQSLEPALAPASTPSSPVPIATELVESGIDDDCIVTFGANGMLFEVLVSKRGPDLSIERKYITRITVHMKSRNDEELDVIFEELQDLLALHCRPWINQFAKKEAHRVQTLYDILYPEIVRLQLITIDDQPKVVLRNDSSTVQVLQPSGQPKKNFSVDIPTFKPSEIKILQTLKADTVFEVSVKGLTRCAKVVGHHDHPSPLKREPAILWQISKADLVPRIRVPALLGLVQSEHDESQVVGFLMEFIEKGTSISEKSIPPIQRDIWNNQIYDDIKRLHDIGVVWGDAKADNIIIDTKNNPWIIDFGGSWTDGWVDRKLAETKEGDFQGLQRIQEFLHARGTEP